MKGVDVGLGGEDGAVVHVGAGMGVGPMLGESSCVR
jgi:hypothetical protein